MTTTTIRTTSKLIPWGRGSRQSKPRVYIHLRGENIIENLVNRRSRPVDVYRQLAQGAIAELELAYDQLSWSQKAGCSCGCSPGFVVNGARGHDAFSYWGPRDLHITVENANVLELPAPDPARVEAVLEALELSPVAEQVIELTSMHPGYGS